jgi:hypothetical protein
MSAITLIIINSIVLLILWVIGMNTIINPKRIKYEGKKYYYEGAFYFEKGDEYSGSRVDIEDKDLITNLLIRVISNHQRQNRITDSLTIFLSFINWYYVVVFFV